MSNFMLVTLILILHFSCYDTRSYTSDVELKTKKPKKPSLEWSNPSSFSSNPTYPEILDLVKVNGAKECNLKAAVKFNKVLEVAKKLVQGILWYLRVEFSDKTIKVITIYEDLDGVLEFDSCLDNF